MWWDWCKKLLSMSRFFWSLGGKHTIKAPGVVNKATDSKTSGLGHGKGSQIRFVLDARCLPLEHKQLLKNAQMELKKSKRKDYYKILGVDKNASEDEIKKAYRKRALMHHPGRAVGSGLCEKSKPGWPTATLSPEWKPQRGSSLGRRCTKFSTLQILGSTEFLSQTSTGLSLKLLWDFETSSLYSPLRSAQWSQCWSSEGGGEKVQGSWRSFYHPLWSQEKDSLWQWTGPGWGGHEYGWWVVWATWEASASICLKTLQRESLWNQPVRSDS